MILGARPACNNSAARWLRSSRKAVFERTMIASAFSTPSALTINPFAAIHANSGQATASIAIDQTSVRRDFKIPRRFFGEVATDGKAKLSASLLTNIFPGTNRPKYGRQINARDRLPSYLLKVARRLRETLLFCCR